MWFVNLLTIFILLLTIRFIYLLVPEIIIGDGLNEEKR